MRILRNLDFEIREEDQSGFMAMVPTYRTDVTREADVIEEILRIYGYNNIEISEQYRSDYLADFPPIDQYRTRFGLSKMLAAQGFYEIYTNSLTKQDYTASRGLKVLICRSAGLQVGVQNHYALVSRT